MAEVYELKQVQVRLKLSEAEPLYSTDQINTPDKAAEVMAKALAQLDREYCCVVNLDAAKHPINFNIVSIGDVNQAQVPIQNVFKSAILTNAVGIMMLHNHPSGTLQASRGDIEVTKRLVEAGKIMNIPIIDHIIVAGNTVENEIPRRFSFRENYPDMFEEKTAGFMAEAETLYEPQHRLDPDKLMVRPTYRNFGVYEMLGENRAQVLFEGSEQECRKKVNELREQYRMGMTGDLFTIYQLKDDASLHDIRFEGLDRLRKENLDADRDNYEVVYEAPLKPGTTLDDIYYQFNMQRPLDFRGHSLSVSDVVILHQKDAVSEDTVDKAFYVDSFGFTELPNFLREKTVQLEEAAYKLGDRYISIQRAEEGYDYSIFDESYHLLDGGLFENSEAKIEGILQEISAELKKPLYDEKSDTYYHSAVQGSILQNDVPKPVSFEDLMKMTETVGQTEIQMVKSEQEIVDHFRADTERLFRPEKADGMRAVDIEDAVREQAQQMIDAYGLDARIEDVIVSGSRSRGLENESSDLDVVVSYSGSEREADFFNILHDDKLFLGRLELDINPINTEQTGTLAEYLPGVEKYLSEKRSDINMSFREPALALMEKFGYELTAEQGKEHFFTEIRPVGQESIIGFDGWQMIHDHFKEVEELTEKYSLDVLKDRLAGKLDVIPYGVMDEQLQVAIRYKEAQEISRDPIDRTEAVKQTVTFTVAECSEFHSLGELYEGIDNLEDAVRLYDKIRQESSLNGIPALGFNLHTAGTSQYEDMQWDFLHGRRLDLDGLNYLPEMRENAEVINALHRLVELYPEVEVIGKFPDGWEKTGFSTRLTAIELATRKLQEYKPLAKVEEMVEENYNQIDNQLSNIPPAGDEKNATPLEKAMRIDENKKEHNRISMKEKLTEKKAEIASRDTKTCDMEKAKRSASMGVDSC